MNEVRNILIGFEFRPDKSQICYYDRKMQDAISLVVKAGSSEYEFPTVLAKKKEEDLWKVGEEAQKLEENDDWYLIKDLYFRMEEGKNLLLDGRDYLVFEIMEQYLKASLEMLGVPEVLDKLRGIMITCPELKKKMVNHLRETCKGLGLANGKFLLCDFEESFYYHTLCQRPELWNRKVALFQFQKNVVSYADLTLNPKSRPMTVLRKQGEVLELSEDKAKRDGQFYEFIGKCFQNQLYSSVFIVGEGFSQTWAAKSILLLCKNHRKVFYGNNLFAKGACLAIKEKLEDHKLKGYLYEGKDFVKSNIGMEMTIAGARSYYPLVSAGSNWYEVEKECEFLLDDTQELVFLVQNLKEQEEKKFSLTLTNLPKRPNKTTKIHLSLSFEFPGKCRIVAKDMGFGELFKSSGQIWTETLDL